MELQTLSKSELIKIAERQQSQIDQLQFELAQLKRAIFGSKSERFIPTPPEQTSMFEKQETHLVEVQGEPPTERKKKKGKQPVRKKLNEKLLREQKVIEPEVDTGTMTKIGEQITEKLAIKPPQIYVIRIVRPKYVDGDGQIHIGQYDDPFPKSNAHSSLAAHVAVQKYVDHCVPRKNVNWIRHSCYIRDEGRPLGFGLQELIPNYCMLLYLRGRVVSDTEKVLERRNHVPYGETTAKEPLKKCRKCRDDVKTGNR